MACFPIANWEKLKILIKKIPAKEKLGKAYVSWEKLEKLVAWLITIKIKANCGILAAYLVFVIFLVLGESEFYQAKVYYTLCDLAWSV